MNIELFRYREIKDKRVDRLFIISKIARTCNRMNSYAAYIVIHPNFTPACVNQALLPFEFSLGNGERVELIADTRALIIKAEVNQ